MTQGSMVLLTVTLIIILDFVAAGRISVYKHTSIVL